MRISALIRRLLFVSCLIRRSESSIWVNVRVLGVATAFINKGSDKPGVEKKLTCGQLINGKNIYMNTPQTATIMAHNTLKCIMMDKRKFKTRVEPIIRALEDKAVIYNAFINQLV